MTTVVVTIEWELSSYSTVPDSHFLFLFVPVLFSSDKYLQVHLVVIVQSDDLPEFVAKVPILASPVCSSYQKSGNLYSSLIHLKDSNIWNLV